MSIDGLVATLGLSLGLVACNKAESDSPDPDPHSDTDSGCPIDTDTDLPPVVTFEPVMPIDPIVTACDATGWCRRYPALDLPTFRSVWAVSENDIWAVGDFQGDTPHSVFWHGDGVTWVENEAIAPANPSAVWGADASTAWAGFANGQLWRWDGTRWAVDQTFPLPVTHVWGTGATDVWVLAHQADHEPQIWHYDGTSWALVDLHLNGSATDITGCGPAEVWVATNSEIARFDGAGWTVFPFGTIELLVRSPDDVWAFGDESRHWDGQDWSLVPGANLPYGGVVFDVDVAEVWFDGTSMWRALKEGVDRWDGAAWELGPRSSVPMASFSVRSEADGWAVGQGIARLDMTGWHVTTGDRGSLESAWAPTDQGDLWVAGGAALLHLEGDTVSSLAEPQMVPTHGVFGFSTDDLWVTSSDDQGSPVWIAHRDAGTWSSEVMPGGGTTGFRHIHGTTPDDLWAASDTMLWGMGPSGWENRGGLRHNSYSLTCPGPYCYLVYGPSALRAMGDGTVVVGSTSSPDRCGRGSGPHWFTTCNPGLQRSGSDGLVPMDGAPEVRQVGGVWSDGPDDVWAFTDLGLLEFDGQSWTVWPHPAAPLPGLADGGLAGTARDDLWAVLGRGVYRWDGDAWHDESPPASVLGRETSDLEQIVVTPQRVWVVGSRGAILELKR